MGKYQNNLGATPTLRYVQINVKHTKEACEELLIFIKTNKIDIAFIQEPWVIDSNKIKGLGLPEYNLLCKPSEGATTRACILARKALKIHLMPNLSSSDTTVALLEEGGNRIILVSAYMSHDNPSPPDSINQLLNSKDRKGQKQEHLIIACDANARHQLWGNKETNERGESLLDFINKNNLIINNKGSVPTFIFPKSETWPGWDAILDLTLSSNTNLKIKEWRVSLEPSFSDHRYILFKSDFSKSPPQEPFRNPRNTDWDKFSSIVKGKLGKIRHTECSTTSIEKTVSRIEDSYKIAFSKTCQITRGKKNNLPSYFDKTLIELRKKLRRQFNVSHITNQWGEYKVLRSLYTKAKRIAKRESWKNLCEAVNTPEGAAKLKKKVGRAIAAPSLIMNTDGTWTDSIQESNSVLLNAHFPGCTTTGQDLKQMEPIPEDNWGSIITSEKIKWAINSFDPYKTPGMDGVMPKMLQISIESITPLLLRIYKDCLRIGYIPTSWRKVRVVFLPKPGKIGHATAKDYRPISLSSFMLKVIERLMDIHIRASFNDINISKTQHAYMKGKSVETALHKVMSYAEKAIHHKQMALTAFLDIEGAFNNVTTDAIREGLVSINTESFIIEWITNMLNSREIHSTIGNNTEVRYVNRGTPQGGVLSPLLWLLVVNQALLQFERTESKIVAYADDLAITIIGLDPKTIKTKMERTLGRFCTWANNAGLNINPKKTELMLFTKKILDFDTPSLQGMKLTLTNKAKFLGVIFTPKLDWRPQVEERAKKAQAAFYCFRSTIGKSWGLSPKITKWILTAIVRPTLLFAVAIWWEALDKTTLTLILNRVQRSVQLGITGAMKTTSSEALEIITGTPPVDIVGKEQAAKTAARLLALKSWETKDYGHSIILSKLAIPTKGMVSDCIIRTTNFERQFKVRFPKRSEWTKNSPLSESKINFFTDGSKTGHGCGAGVWSKWQHTKHSYKLPDFATVFQSEIFAIIMSCDIIISRHTKNEDINIFVDSQAALKAIEAPYIKSALIKRCVDTLNEVCKQNRVTLQWVPGHSDIEGNELADLLARQGSSQHKSWAIKIECPMAHINGLISDRLSKEWRKRWEISEKGKISKIIWPELDQKATDKLLSYPRHTIKSIMYTVTGHWNIGKHAQRLGIETSPNCMGCDISKLDIEPFHFWCDCPGLARLRLEIFDNYFLFELPSIRKYRLELLLEYIRKSGWFSGYN